MTIFTPDNNHCPQSCLCPMCKNDTECDDACAEYKLMSQGCMGDCGECKIIKSDRMEE